MYRAKLLAVAAASELVADALVNRRLPSNLMVPSWVMKDQAFYKKVRARGFKSQRGLDNFVSNEAMRRKHGVVRYSQKISRDQYALDTGGCILPKSDRRRVAKADFLNKLRDREARLG